MTTSQRIAVVGCGQVGVVTGAGFAELGHTVTGVDIDGARVAQLTAGRLPFMEPGLQDLVSANVARGRLRFTTSYSEALDGAEFIFLCVNTPATITGAADLRAVRAAVREIAAILLTRDEQPLIVNKSTSPIGTGETIETILRRTFPGRTAPAIVANPEFLREGTAVHDFLHPDRIVVGAESAEAAARVAELYRALEAPTIITDLRAAEMIKYVSNAFLAARISFVNEIARLCEHLGVDADGVIGGAAMDPRIGSAFFTPGIGYGGSCLPKDVAALCHTGESVGLVMRVLMAVQETNVSQRTHAVNCIRRALGTLEGATIGVWGITFKGGTADQRESPALDVIALLRNEGATVTVFDPTLDPNDPGTVADRVAADALDAVTGADCLAVLADWTQFRDVPWDDVRQRMAGRLVYDGRNVLSRAAVEAAGLTYHGVGRPPAFDGPPVAAAVLQ